MRPLLTEKEAAKALNVSVRTLQGWRVRGIGPRHVKLGDTLRAPVRYQPEEMERVVDNACRASTSTSEAA